MLSRIASSVSRHPWRVIVVWLVAGAIATLYSQAHQSDVTTDDTSSFLPNKYESVRATKLGEREFGMAKGASTVTLLVKRSDGARLGATDQRQIAALTAGTLHWQPDWSQVQPVGGKGHGVKPSSSQRETRVLSAQASPPQDGGRFELLSMQFKGNDFDPVVQGAFFQFRATAQQQFRAHGLNAGFTGGVASAGDNQKANASTASLEQLLLYAAIVLLSLVFFRGLLSSIVPLLTVGVVATGAERARRAGRIGLRLQDRRVVAVARHHGADRDRSRLLPVHDVPLPRAASRRR